MTINEAIQILDQQKYNTCSREEKLRWLTELDSQVALLLFGPEATLPFYCPATDPDTRLMIAAPFQEAYIYYLEGKIDYLNGDITRFNNANAMFHSLWQRYGAYLHRNRGKAVQNRFF